MRRLFISRTTNVLYLLILLASVAQAQIEPPDFTCVRNDTLFWEVPAVTCGPVEGYAVYRSDALSGPFVEIDVVMDPTATSYAHSNPGNLTYYFYLETIANCPGQNPVASDTLDNLLPPEIPINHVSVSGTDVIIEWNSVAEEEAAGYIIYRTTPSGTLPVDTVYGMVNTYTDTAVDASISVESYYVNSIDNCGQSSFFNELHNTMLPNVLIDPCTQSAQISWNAYNGWPDGVQRYTIEASLDGGAFVQVGEAGASSTTFSYEGLDKNITYRIRVNAISIEGYVAVSAIIEFQPNIVQTILDLNLFNASVQDNGEVEVSWTWDITSEVADVRLLYSTDGGANQAIDIPVDTANLSLIENYTLGLPVNANTERYQMSLEVTDACGQVVQSNIMSTIFLTGAINPSGASVLNWNLPPTAMRDILGQEVISVADDGSMTLLASILPAQRTFQDFNPSLISSCYKVQQTGQVNLSDGSSYDFIQESNVVCVAKPVLVYVPNAIAPKGTNSIFKPALINPGNITSYRLSVFDRWGNRLFMSETPEIGWDGTANGKRVPTGVYVWNLELDEANGEGQRLQGTVHVIY